MAKNRIVAKLNPQDLRRVQNTLKNLPANLQRKVLVQASRRTVKDVVRPAVIDRIGVRSFDPPEWRARRGVGAPERSHDKAPGILKRMMGKNVTKRIKSIKRSRKEVGHFLITPTREELGISDGYGQYYPAALEFGMGNPIGTPRPFMRGTFRMHQSRIMREFSKIAKSRMHYLKARGKI